MSDPEKIWLEPACAGEAYPDGRCWSAAPLDDCGECEFKAVAYVRADLVERLHAALRLGAAMRAAQRAYFAERSRDNLIASKQAEAAFDAATQALTEASR